MQRFRTLSIWLPALAAVVCAGIAWWRYGETLRLRGELATARSQIDRLEKDLAGSRAAADRSAESYVRPAAAVPAAANRGTPPADPAFSPPPRGMAFVNQLLDDPEAAPLLASQRRQMVEQRYAALFARLNLPPAQLEKLKSLLADKQLAGTEAMALARTQGLGRDDARAAIQQANADSDAQIKATIGDAAFASLQNYDSTFPQRTVVNDLAQRLDAAGTALQTAQREQLVQILADNALPGTNNAAMPFMPGGGRGGGPGFFAAMGGPNLGDGDVGQYLSDKAIKDAATLQQAATVLTPPQLQLLQQMQEEQNNQIRLGALIRSRFRQNAPPPNPPN
jgi:hypothetical protein